MSEKNRSSGGIRALYEKNEDSILKVLFLLAMCFFGMLLRYKLFPKVSGDVGSFLIPWYDYLKEHGGFKAVGDKIGDYTPMYYYFMAALTYTKLDVNVGLKLISIFFDFIMSVYVMKIVKLREPDESHMPVIAFGVAFCLPTVVINSAAWAQCDVIYTTFLVMCLYYILCGRDSLAMIMFGISFSFKVQAIFLLPLIGILIMKRKMRWRTLLWIPAVYVMSIIPATIAGGDFKRLLTVYLFQSGQYPQLTLSLANVWAIFEGMENEELGSAGIFFAGITVIIMMYYYITNKKLTVTKNTVIGMAMMSSFLVPFVLPHMHERYMYLTEIMFVIFSFYYRKRAWLIATSQYCSVQCLLRFLYGHDSMDMRWLALIQIVNIAFVFYTLREEIASPSDEGAIKMVFEKKAEQRLKEAEILRAAEEIRRSQQEAEESAESEIGAEAPEDLSETVYIPEEKLSEALDEAPVIIDSEE